MSSESPPTLLTEECEKLLDALLSNDRTAKKKLKAVRNHCMALLMLDAGLRVGELVSLRLSNLFFNSKPVRTIIIKPHMTKNKVEHAVPVSDRLSESLAAYYKSQPCIQDFEGSHPAFANFLKDTAITTRQVERIICAAGWKALGRPVHPHILRHTCASRLMRVTNSSTVQNILGHKYLSSTQIYCHPNEDDKRQAIDSASQSVKPEEACQQPQPRPESPTVLQPPKPLQACPSGPHPAFH